MHGLLFNCVAPASRNVALQKPDIEIDLVLTQINLAQPPGDGIMIAVDTGRSTRLRDKTGWKLRCRLVHARGHIIWVDYVAEVITDAYGQTTAIVGSFRDISNAQRYQRMFYQIEALRNERGLGFFSVDILTKTTYWSPNIYTLLNVEDTGADVFDTVVEMLIPDDRGRFNDLRDTAITAGDGFDGSFRIKRPDHAEAELSVSMQTTSDQQGNTTDNLAC